MTRTIRLLACAAAAAIAAPALASGVATATATATGPDGTSVTTVHDGDGAGGTERVIVLTDRHHGDGPEGAADGERHRVRVFNVDGDHLADCGPDRRVIDRTSPDGHERSKVVICTRGGEAVSP